MQNILADLMHLTQGHKMTFIFVVHQCVWVGLWEAVLALAPAIFFSISRNSGLHQCSVRRWRKNVHPTSLEQCGKPCFPVIFAWFSGCMLSRHFACFQIVNNFINSFLHLYNHVYVYFLCWYLGMPLFVSDQFKSFIFIQMSVGVVLPRILPASLHAEFLSYIYSISSITLHGHAHFFFFLILILFCCFACDQQFRHVIHAILAWLVRCKV